jgi:ABC-2 type transport system permease protein
MTMALKDISLMRRDWLGMFFIVAFPVLMGVLFGVIAGSFGQTDDISLEIAVVDQDKSEMSSKFIESLSDNEQIVVKQMERQASLDQVRRGRLTGVVVIPRDFGESAGIFWAQDRPAIQLGVDPSRSFAGGMLQGLVMQAAGELMSDRMRDPDGMRSMVQKTQEQLLDDSDVPGTMRPLLSVMLQSLDGFLASWARWQKEEGNAADGGAGPAVKLANVEMIDVTQGTQLDDADSREVTIHSRWDISFPQAMMWGVLGSAAAFAITMVRERTQGTFLRLQVAPIARSDVLAGKAVACAITVLAVIALLVALGTLLGMRTQRPGLLLLAAVSITYCFVGIMMLMSVVGKSEEAVSGAAWGANVLMAMFGGGMIPLMFMPGFMRAISNVSPVKWSIVALEGAIWREFTLLEMLFPCAVLLLFGTVGLAVGTFLLSRARM